MHPVWMEKLEEQRKVSVSTFWVVMVFIVVLPLLLLVSTNPFVILGLLCFVGAGLRLYWQDFGKPATEPMTSEMRDIKIKEAFEKYSSAPLPGVAAPVRTIQISVTANQEHPAETTATASESETDDAKFIAPDERFQPSIDTVRSSLEALQEPPKEEEPLQPIVDEVPQPIKRAAGHFHDMIN